MYDTRLASLEKRKGVDTQPHGAIVQIPDGDACRIDADGFWGSLVAWERLHTYQFLPISEIHQPPMLRKQHQLSVVMEGPFCYTRFMDNDNPLPYLFAICIALVIALIIYTLAFVLPIVVGAFLGWSYSVSSTRDKRKWSIWEWRSLGKHQRKLMKSSLWGTDQKMWSIYGAVIGLVVSIILTFIF